LGIPDSYWEVPWETLYSRHRCRWKGSSLAPTRASSIHWARAANDWVFDGDPDPDAEVVAEVHARTGAIIIRKRMFDLGVGPWGDPPAVHVPVFVVTREAREPLVKQGGTRSATALYVSMSPRPQRPRLRRPDEQA
jgi:hypothetical protein